MDRTRTRTTVDHQGTYHPTTRVPPYPRVRCARCTLCPWTPVQGFTRLHLNTMAGPQHRSVQNAKTRLLGKNPTFRHKPDFSAKSDISAKTDRETGEISTFWPKLTHFGQNVYNSLIFTVLPESLSLAHGFGPRKSIKTVVFGVSQT